MNVANGVSVPFRQIDPTGVECQSEGISSTVGVSKGICLKPDNGAVLQIRSQANTVMLNLR